MACLLAGLLLVGCSAEPSESDIKAAFEDSLKEADKAAAMFGGGQRSMKSSDIVKLHSIKKLNCRKGASSVQHVCDVEFDIESFGIRQKSAGPITLTKGTDRWFVSK